MLAWTIFSLSSRASGIHLSLLEVCLAFDMRSVRVLPLLLGKVDMGANVPKIAHSRYLQTLAIPVIPRQEISSSLVSCKAEAFVISNLCTDVVKEGATEGHGVNKPGLMPMTSGYYHEIVSQTPGGDIGFSRPEATRPCPDVACL